MSRRHAADEPVAEAEIVPPESEEADDVREPRLLQLYLDSDAAYRWYEEEEASDVASGTLVGALEAAAGAWGGFQLVEFRGEPVRPDSEIEDRDAEDELREIAEEA